MPPRPKKRQRRTSGQKITRPWQEIATEAKTYRNSTIAKLIPAPPTIPTVLPKDRSRIPEQLLDDQVCSITNQLPEQLIASLQNGQLSAVDVTIAFLQRAAVCQGLSNCLTELLPKIALDRAKELDAHFAKYGPIGPLHGLPISLKEHIGIRGLRCTTGYISQWNVISKEDAHILQVLFAAGAVPHCRTTIPQTMMHLETDSNLYGVTTNPYNHNLSAGGSSGGEGALIALQGSCLGVGSDVGGSIRSPAANCGIYGLKPTAFRLPTDGWGLTMAGADSVDCVMGPLSTSLEGLKIFMKTIVDSEPWIEEPALIPMPWRTYTVPHDEPLRIGILWHNGILVNFPPRLHHEAWAIQESLYFTTGGEDVSDLIAQSGEPWRPLSEWIVRENGCVKKLSVSELDYWLQERELYRKEYAVHWNKYNIDALLCPVGPGVAPKHNTAKYWNYTSQWNLLDYPAVAFPVCTVNKNVDKWDNDFNDSIPGPKICPDNLKHEENHKLWDPEEFHGAPVGLQLVGRRFDDEKILGILEHIQSMIDLPFESS